MRLSHPFASLSSVGPLPAGGDDRRRLAAAVALDRGDQPVLVGHRGQHGRRRRRRTCAGSRRSGRRRVSDGARGVEAVDLAAVARGDRDDAAGAARQRPVDLAQARRPCSVKRMPPSRMSDARRGPSSSRGAPGRPRPRPGRPRARRRRASAACRRAATARMRSLSSSAKTSAPSGATSTLRGRPARRWRAGLRRCRARRRARRPRSDDPVVPDAADPHAGRSPVVGDVERAVGPDVEATRRAELGLARGMAVHRRAGAGSRCRRPSRPARPGRSAGRDSPAGPVSA